MPYGRGVHEGLAVPVYVLSEVEKELRQVKVGLATPVWIINPGGGGGTGEDGKSAYEIAVENGFVGTESEWLDSLQGEQGEQGIQGIPGEDGADGTSVSILGSYDTVEDLEAAHPTGTIGDGYLINGDLYVWNGSAWENVGNIQGPQGEPGINGADGLSAYEVAVNNGFVGTEVEWLASLEGTDGTSVTILGSYDTVEDLEAAHPTGSLGDGYLIAGDLYVWTGSEWENVGNIQGPQGIQGIPGIQTGIALTFSTANISFAEPPSGTFGLVPVNFATTTQIGISYTDNLGNDVEDLVKSIGYQATLFLQKEGNPNIFVIYSVEGHSDYAISRYYNITGRVISGSISGGDHIRLNFTTVGQVGADGDTGESAYEIAVDNGFVGTEADWLDSLVGPQGDPGTPYQKFAGNIGDNVTTSIVVTHSLGTVDVHVAVKDNSTLEIVYPNIIITDSDNITLEFAIAPTTDEYRVVVLG